MDTLDCELRSSLSFHSSPFRLRAKDTDSMTISMYKTSVPIFVQFLPSMSAVLDKAAAHCEAKKIEPATLLNMRLYPDMFPLVRQLRAVTDHAISATARLAGAELITFPNNEASFPEVKDRIAKTIEFIKSFKPEQINGTEDKEIVVKFSSGERKFNGPEFRQEPIGARAVGGGIDEPRNSRRKLHRAIMGRRTI